MTRQLVFILFIIFVIFGIIFAWFYLFYFNQISNFLLISVKITIPEGYTLEDIANKFKPFKNFNRDNFFKIAKEGYLFPDTYFLTGKETEENIIKIMEDNFKKKVVPILEKNRESPISSKEIGSILIMASLLEKESGISEERKIISGILWKRLEAEMPLQVDCSLETYSCQGLPLAPICNPGLDSIGAALNPVESEYWYYLHDKNGIIHYAKTFEEHKINKAKYLTK